MITTYRVKLERCNGCHSQDRVVEFKIEPTASTAQLVRFCHACRAVMRNALEAILKNDERDDRVYPRCFHNPGAHPGQPCPGPPGGWDDDGDRPPRPQAREPHPTRKKPRSTPTIRKPAPRRRKP
jgi:hypothetical protein